MTELEQTLAALLREWQVAGMCWCWDGNNRPLCRHCRTRDALALYDRMAQEISQERTETTPARS